MTRSHLTVTTLLLAALVFATSCSQLDSTTVVGQGATSGSGDSALVAAISNDVLFQSDPLTTDLEEAICIGEQTVGKIGRQRLADAGVTVAFPNPLAADLTEPEVAEVLQLIEECTGVRTSAAGAENATGAVENVAAPTEPVADEPTTEPAEAEEDDEDAESAATEAELVVADAGEINEADTAVAPEEVTTDDETPEEAVEDGQAETDTVTGAAIEVAAVEPATSLTDADRVKLAGFFGALGADTSEQAQCMVVSAVSELSLTTETAAALIATSPLPMPERRAVNRALVSCKDMRPLIQAVLETSGMPADQVGCLATNLDIQGQVDVFSNINAIVANPYEAMRTHLGNNPALGTCGI